MSKKRMTEMAMELMRIGVSHSGVQDLLGRHDLDEVERQLAYLPFRKAKRPEAFIIEAVRRKYSPPKEFFYAKDQAQPSHSEEQLDQDPQFFVGPSNADAQGYGAPSAASDPSANNRI